MEANTSDFYYWADSLIYLISILGRGLCLSYLLRGFLKNRHANAILDTLAPTAIYMALCIGSEELFPAASDSLFRSVGKMTLFCLTIWLIIRLFYVSLPSFRAFLTITFMALSEISLFITYTILYIGGNISQLWIWCMDRGYFSSAKHFLLTVEGSMVILYFLQQTALLALLFFSEKKIIRDFHGKEYFIQPAEVRFLLFPGLTGLFLCLLLRTIMITVRDGIPQLLYQEFPLLSLLVPSIALLSLFSILSGVKLFQDMVSLQQEKNNRILLQKEISSLQKQILETDRLYSGIRGLKHDLKNILTVCLKLKQGSYQDPLLSQELEGYLTQLKLNMDAFVDGFQTGNRVVDTLLGMKQYEISRWSNTLYIDAYGLLFSERPGIESYDLAIILGNALDNAIEACHRLWERDRDAKLFIRLSSFEKNGLFFLETSNSFLGELKPEPSQEFPLTTKTEDRNSHGIGMMNIKATALKYDGEADWEADGAVFRLTVMMKPEKKSVKKSENAADIDNS